MAKATRERIITVNKHLRPIRLTFLVEKDDRKTLREVVDKLASIKTKDQVLSLKEVMQYLSVSRSVVEKSMFA